MLSLICKDLFVFHCSVKETSLPVIQGHVLILTRGVTKWLIVKISAMKETVNL